MNNERNELILDLAVEGFWDWDLKSDLAYLSPRYCELAGYSPDDTTFNSAFLRMIIHPDDHNHVFTIIAEHLQGRLDSSVIEYRMISKDGTVRWIEGKGKIAAYDEQGAPVRLVGTISDITVRKNIERKLLLSEEKFATAFHSSPDSVNINRLNDGLYIETNAGFTAMTGYTAGDVLGRSSLELDIWADAGDRARLVNELNINGCVNNLEARFRCKDGSVKDGLMSARIIMIENEPCILSITRDITDRKRAEEELQKKSADMEQFIYTTSHDLRSPLVTISTFLEYLKSDMNSGNQERIVQDLQYIQGAAAKMKLLLDELLELSRIDRVDANPVRIELDAVLSEVQDVLAGFITEQKAELRLSGTNIILHGDRSRLCQIWQNLIENAIKYRSEERVPLIELGTRLIDGELVFFVKDNGIGIEPKYHQKIFGIFEKLDSRSTGAGLGLSMIKRIVEKRRGRVWVESQGSDRGSCFFFTLPDAIEQN
jgi:PAS domain S-box-containing protein